jgi:hypothetical protein
MFGDERFYLMQKSTSAKRTEAINTPGSRIKMKASKN